MEENENTEGEEEFDGDFVSNSDQMLAQMGEVARVTATYTGMLIANGLPAEVAFAMSVDWHKSYWESAHHAAMDVFGDEFYGEDEDEEDE